MNTNMLSNEQIARVCHESNRAYCLAIGDDTQKPWSEAEEWQRESAVNGVVYALANPDAPDSAQHDSWVQGKLDAGWKHGPVKDADLKTHPCIVPYDQLSIEQRRKDALFKAVVKALS